MGLFSKERARREREYYELKSLLRSSVDESRKYTEAIKEQTQKYSELKEKEIKAKDRVDITLAEYEAMKSEISELKELVNCWEIRYERIYNLLRLIKIPPQLIEANKIKDVEWFEDFDIDYNVSRYMFKFAVDRLEAKYGGLDEALRRDNYGFK